MQDPTHHTQPRPYIRKGAAGLVVLVSLLAGLAITAGPASAAGPPCAGANYYLYDPVPTPTCAVMSPPITFENLVPAVIARKPPYGWYPATCVLAGKRWDGSYNPYTTQPNGTLYASARIVQDDGYCMGPTVNATITLTTQLWFNNIYGVGGSYGSICTPSTSSTTGAAALVHTSAPCAGHTYAGPLDDWERGYYRYDVTVYTTIGNWFLSGTHQLT